MTKECWLSLPVKDLEKSKEFFAAIGFTFHPRHRDSEDMAGLVVGDKKVLVMLVPEPAFRNFTRSEIADAKRAAEVLISIDAESREEVDELAKKVADAGGTIYGEPQESQGWMYGAGFADPDGHRWNVLYMDTRRMPTAGLDARSRAR